MSVSSNEALVRRAVEAIWNLGDFDVADELFSDDYVNHYGLITDLVRGPEAVKISAALHRVAFPDLHVSIEEVSSVKDTVIVRWNAGTVSSDRANSGAFAAKPRSLNGVTHGRIAAGKIIESWTE